MAPLQQFALVIGGILALLIVSEVLWHMKLIRGEMGRKFVHMTAGLLIASWPLLISFRTIQILSMCFIAAIYVSKRFNILKSIHAVDRKSYGEYGYAIGVGISSVLFPQPRVFASAVLVMAVADAFAALIGTKWGRHKYKVGKDTKSLEGSAAFYITCALIYSGLLLVKGEFANQSLMQTVYISGGAAVLMIVEALGIYGTDNIALPIAAGLIANQLFR